MKYIDAEKLKAELNKRIELLENGDAHSEVMKRVEGVVKGYKAALSIIDSLQQEQPEVDFEKEVRTYCGSSFRFNYDELNDSFYSNTFEFDDAVELARHFYELGRNARKEE